MFTTHILTITSPTTSTSTVYGTRAHALRAVELAAAQEGRTVSHGRPFAGVTGVRDHGFLTNGDNVTTWPSFYIRAGVGA
jgi:hypothetical protein